MEREENNSSQIAGYIFVGFMFAGMGVDMITGNGVAGMFIGLGLGFIVSAMYRSEKNK